MFFANRAYKNLFINSAIALTAGVALASLTQAVHANPASDRAFGNCVTAAAAYLETRGHQIGNVTVLARDADQHRMRITPASTTAEPAAIICTASHQTTSIEVVSESLALTNTPR